MIKKDEKILKDAEEKGIPIFIFTAKDILSTRALVLYRRECVRNGCPDEFNESMNERIEEFKAWQSEHPELCKNPD